MEHRCRRSPSMLYGDPLPPYRPWRGRRLVVAIVIANAAGLGWAYAKKPEPRILVRPEHARPLMDPMPIARPDPWIRPGPGSPFSSVSPDGSIQAHFEGREISLVRNRGMRTEKTIYTERPVARIAFASSDALAILDTDARLTVWDFTTNSYPMIAREIRSVIAGSGHIVAADGDGGVEVFDARGRSIRRMQLAAAPVTLHTITGATNSFTWSTTAARIQVSALSSPRSRRR